ncbi:MAG: hypothetical protein LAN62_18140 [Acidobacteriia bacterium]|nr:hypothetical protein [Terriglobia bacterium]
MGTKPEEVIKAKLALSEDSLLEELGASIITTEGLDLRDLKPEELRQRAEQWLDLHSAKIAQTICKDWKFSEKIREPKFQDRLNLAAAIADVVSGIWVNVSPFSLAALLVKRGIEELCA